MNLDGKGPVEPELDRDGQGLVVQGPQVQARRWVVESITFLGVVCIELSQVT